jgi:hypothetical protein
MPRGALSNRRRPAQAKILVVTPDRSWASTPAVVTDWVRNDPGPGRMNGPQTVASATA